MTSPIDSGAWSASAAGLHVTTAASSSRASIGFRACIGATLLVGLVILWANPNYQWSTRCDQPYGADFLQEWTAGDMVLAGAATQIYDAQAFDRWQHDADRVGFEWSTSGYYPAVYPPLYYALLSPLAALPYRWAVTVWCAVLLMAYVLSARLHAWRPWSSSSNQSSNQSSNRSSNRCVSQQSDIPWLFWIAGLLFPAMFSGCVMGQKGSLWLLILVGSWQLLRCNRPYSSGALAGLLILKPTLAPVLVAAMLLNRQWRYCIGFASGATLLLVIGLLTLPHSLWNDYLQVILGSANYQDHSGYRTGWSTSLITLYQSLALPRAAVIGLWIASSSLIMLSLIRPQRQSAADSGDSVGQDQPLHEDPYWLFSVLIATALVSPHFYYYDLVWLLYPLCGIWMNHARHGMFGLLALWLGILVAQQWESGFPILSAVLSLCAITLHVKYRYAATRNQVADQCCRMDCIR